MATIALAAAGGAIGGPFGQAIGAAIGSWIDNKFLFPPDPVAGQRMGELQVQGMDEGHPMNRVHGEGYRVAGAPIFISDLFETKTTEEVGGKGGGQKVENYTYSVDIAFAFCEGEIEEFSKIILDTRTFYVQDPELAYSSDQVSISVREIYREVHNGEGQVTTTLHKLYGELESSATGPDFSEMYVGKDVLLGGFTETDYNGTFRVLATYRDEDTGISYLTVDLDSIIFSTAGEAAGNTITIDQGFAQGVTRFDPADATAVTVYLGTETQTADALLEGHLGTGQVPGYRGVAYVVIEGLQLEPHGNRIPNSNAIVVEHTGRTLGEVIERVIDDAFALESTLSTANRDASVLSTVLQGYGTRGPAPTSDILSPLMIAYNLVSQDNNGVLEFFERTNAVEIEVDEEDVASHPSGQDVFRPFEVRDISIAKLPTKVVTKYVDVNSRLQPGSQSAIRQASVVPNVLTMELPVVLTAAEARAVAERMLWMPYANRQIVSLNLPPSYLTALENDILLIPRGTDTYRVIVQRVDDGKNGIKNFETVIEEQGPHVWVVDADDIENPDDEGLSFAPFSFFMLIDVGPLRDQEVEEPGVYFACAYSDPRVTWAGATLYESQDSEVSYDALTAFSSEASMGYADSQLGAGTGEGQWDRGSVFEVVLLNGTLASVTELQCLNGRNRMIVGGEVIGFTTVTLGASQPPFGRRYELTNLLRGLQGTEDRAGSHEIGEIVVHLNSAGVQFQPMGISNLNATRHYKSVAAGGDVADASAFGTSIRLNTIRPVAPGNLSMSYRDRSSGDWVLKWVRRSRQSCRVLGTVTPPLNEPEENYEVDIMDGPDVIRTISVSSATTTTYLAATQTTDFGSPQATLTFRVYQMSDLVGRGKQAEISL